MIVGVTGVVLPPPPPPQAVSRREIERARSVDRLNSAAGTAFTTERDTDIQSPSEHLVSVSHSPLFPVTSAHAPEMKPEQKQEQAVTPQREIAQKQEQGEDFGLGL